MGTKSLPCLYIPDDSSPTQRVEPRTLIFPPSKSFDDVVCQLLRCRFRAAEIIIYSEDELAKFDGAPDGLAPNKPFVLYEAYMDDNGNATRPYSSRAAHLLSRPKSYGPMIIVKMTLTKSNDGELELVKYHCLTQDELESPAFQSKRVEYETKHARYSEEMRESLRALGFLIVDLN